ncbi:MAG: biotin transporter BioY [Candidatus Limivicinus sp.]|jgi:biotin transport system substrate-specific component
MKTKTGKIRTAEMAYIALFAVLIAVCSWISIPAAVPFTMQTFAVFAAVGLLGGRRGSIAVAVYLLLGAVGLPVFAGFKGGFGVLLGSTGGYIAGFLLSALAMWLMEKLFGKSTPVLALSMFVGLIICYAFGTAWFMQVYAKTSGEIGVLTALGFCVFPYIIPDTLKILLALFLTKKLGPHIRLD